MMGQNINVPQRIGPMFSGLSNVLTVISSGRSGYKNVVIDSPSDRKQTHGLDVFRREDFPFAVEHSK